MTQHRKVLWIGSVKGKACFYVDNEKDVAYFWKCVMQIQIPYNFMQP